MWIILEILKSLNDRLWEVLGILVELIFGNGKWRVATPPVSISAFLSAVIIWSGISFSFGAKKL